MAYLKINHEKITPERGEALVKLCPFGAIGYEGGRLDISSACKMCKMCVRRGEGAVELVEDKPVEVDNSAYRGVLVYADVSEGQIHRVTYELIGKARELAAVIHHPVYVLMMGSGLEKAAKSILRYGVDKVFVYDDPALSDFTVESYTAVFCDLIEKEKPSSVLVGATNLGRQLAPRVAARCRTGLTADCTVLGMKENTDLIQIRPAFGGNIMAQIITPATRPQFCTVRYKVFDEPKPSDGTRGEVVNMTVTAEMLKSGVRVLSKERKPREVDISESEVLVAVGRGACGDAVLKQAEELAELLGGMVACTRPLVENGLFDPKRQIGLSGRTVKPKLIITLGISGAVQFTAGMSSSECIVAINTDPSAPIFDVAHYCVVGDVNEILPRLIAEIKEVRDVR